MPMTDPMKAMKACKNRCEEVPGQVSEAVFAAFDEIPGVDEESREARSKAVAERMAKEGWRFCPCFPARRTPLHQRVFALVHTNLANRVAHRIALAEQTATQNPAMGGARRSESRFAESAPRRAQPSY